MRAIHHIATRDPLTVPARRTWPVYGLFFIALVFLLREAKAVLVPIAIAIVLTFVLSPAIRKLRLHGIPEFIGAGILVTALIGALVILGATLAGPATVWWENLPVSVQQLTQQVEHLRSQIGIPAPSRPPFLSTSPYLRPALPLSGSPPGDPVKEKIVSESVALTGLVIGRALSIGLSTIATLILLYFLLASEHWLLSRTVEAIQRHRTRALLIAGVRNAQREIARFVGALSIINFGVGVLTVVIMSYLKLPNPVLWGSMAGILNFIPYIGPIVIAGLLVLAGAISFSATPALILAPAAGFLLLHAIESNFVSPWFIGRQLALSRISIILSVMFWGWLWGIAGAMIAVPLLIGLRSMCKRIRRLRRFCVYLNQNISPSPDLRSLLTRGASTETQTMAKPQ